MSELKTIPCTVAILTRDSAEVLPRALESIRNFAEIIVCDSSSKDGTRDIARTYGARLIDQDPAYLTLDGRISHYGEVRNQTLDAASYDWFLFLDSDEYLPEDTVEAIRTIVASASPAAYWMFRTYVYNGVAIRYANTYPNRTMRLFHRSKAKRFIKEVHERIELMPDAPIRTMDADMHVPLPDSAKVLMNRWKRYLQMEKIRRESISLRHWFGILFHELGIAVLYLLRTGRDIILFRSPRLPISFELARVWYQFALISGALEAVRRL